MISNIRTQIENSQKKYGGFHKLRKQARGEGGQPNAYATKVVFGREFPSKKCGEPLS